jgi:hypothetical protein
MNNDIFGPKYQKRLKQIQRVLDDAIAANSVSTRQIAYEGKRMVQENLNRPGNYRLYYVDGKPHYSSAPGSPPAPITGKLRDSIVAGSTSPMDGANPAVGWIGTDVEYAIELEFGRGGENKTAPRPFLRGLVRNQEFQQYVTNTVRENWNKTIRNSVPRHIKDVN